ncbi:ATP-dependent DNA helicase Rep [Ectothiorhodospira haloalkaliphila]|uniref:ATP-dependent DNA helicase Rep n=1 Tax=Ectothiorhodospira haloalkaliphila TaxID=421628 RepID=W8KPW4_9GAMM|nr:MULTISPECIES: DNA helicase Rep [Ectothiorhodospira]AHK79047.1 ATP-dependent DNA helicase Rep [Ectothiorhodospira haloalkaliphila]MCG5494824.1 DNA helicase Rep [Ectothiorhodospira variabilis]MCG5497612.1 DNA helicase Rep [Ectothiorhodospira variabilis]MCG5504287.1 DNA helicase Rep [Ectothiorhodospira variabilis]MCG5507442.1 DNA helicase Rep [Ectothiorhodospira variabilis]
MDTLNPQQRAAVEYVDGPLLVLAGAGSGKTRVITQKIAHLIRDKGMAPRHIAAITFTNKAAREMKERAGKLLSREESRGLTVSTFHTLGLDFIRREIRQLGYRPGFTIFDAADALSLLKQLTHRHDEGVEVESARHRISRWKNDLISAEAALSHAADEVEAGQARLYAAYQRALKAYNAVDFDDLIILPVHLMEENLEVRDRWRHRLRHLLVDEYQDTNACQYRLVKLLVDVEGGLTAVGDDDQSIYAWRGARPENLVTLQQDFPRLKIVKLEQNYRSTNVILQTANRLIANNPHVFEKRLWSGLGKGEPIRILPCKDGEHEATRVVSEIMKHRFKHRTEYKDYAILYRGNHQARVFEKLLRENSIPYKVSGGQSFFERAEVKDVLAYLRLLANPDDDSAFLRIVNVPRREIGAGTLEKLGEYASSRHVSLFTASQEMGLTEVLSSRAVGRVQGFADWLREHSMKAGQEDPAQVARTLVEDMRYEDWLLEQSANPKAASRRMENVNEVLDWMGRLSREGAAGGKNIGEIVAHMTLMDILDRAGGEAEADGVHLMTLHAAKGLEFPHVFLVGMEEELLPHRVSLEEDTLEEERRLAYVGITRAQKGLTLTYACRRTRYGEIVDCEPSRFLQELPEEFLEWPDAKPPDPEEVKLTGKAHLSNLKSLLG